MLGSRVEKHDEPIRQMPRWNPVTTIRARPLPYVRLAPCLLCHAFLAHLPPSSSPPSLCFLLLMPPIIFLLLSDKELGAFSHFHQQIPENLAPLFFALSSKYADEQKNRKRGFPAPPQQWTARDQPLIRFFCSSGYIDLQHFRSIVCYHLSFIYNCHVWYV